MTKKRIPVVGDWITSPLWGGLTYYEVAKVTETKLWLKVGGFPPVDYSINSHDWEFKPTSLRTEEAISLLTSLGYTITEPKPKLTGWVNIISNGVSARPEHGKVWDTKEEADKMGLHPNYAKWETGYKRIACVPFTEGDGI